MFSLGDDTLAAFTARAQQGTPGLNRARLAGAGPVVTAATAGEARQQVATNAAMKGVTPTTATREAARCMALDDEVGTLEAGKWADFVALSADPLVDIRNTRTIDSVWIAGNRAAR